MKRKLLSLLVLLMTAVSGAWADWDGGTYTATADEEITRIVHVSTATLTINSGKTVTVWGCIEINGTLTVTGGGKLIVNGSSGGASIDGGDAIIGNVVVKGANIEAKGGNGDDGDEGGDGGDGEDGGEGGIGGDGGNAFNGTVIIYSGSVYATGGNGGQGGQGGDGGGYWCEEPETDEEGNPIGAPVEHPAGNGGQGGSGGDGGKAFNGTVIFYGGSVYATGGYAGLGGDGGYSEGSYGDAGLPGNLGYAFSGDNVTFETTNYDMRCYDYDGVDYVENNNSNVSYHHQVNIDAADCIPMTARLANGAYWTTFYSGDSYNFIAPEGTQVFTISLDNTTGTITLNEIADRIVAAGHGVVLKQATTASETTATIPMVKTNSDSAGNYDTNALTGTATSITNPGNAYVLNSGSQGVGFYKLKSTGTIGANKAYLTYSGALAREFFGFDEATGIDATLMNSEKVDGVVYDLQGRRVSQPAKGLYIVNGKKYIKK